MIEHRWEKYTNYAIILGLLSTSFAYYYKFTYTSEIGLSSICVIGFIHLIARIGHKAEQILMRETRGWKK